MIRADGGLATRPLRATLPLLAAGLLLAGAPGATAAQERAGDAAETRPELVVERAQGGSQRIVTWTERGYAAVPLAALRELGWSASREGTHLDLATSEGARVALTLESPFFRWNGVALQLVEAPYESRGEVYVPVQLLVDVAPERARDRYAFDARSWTLRVSEVAPEAGGGAGRGDEPAPAPGAAAGPAGGPAAGDPSAPEPLPDVAQPSPYDGVRVVWIDAGHGGADPGAIGPGGIREKDVALGISREVARLLSREANLEVRMTREDDDFVDVWDRGLRATEFKGERPGIFVSIHANSFPQRRAARGFETYFLSEARTEHERRVSAIENAPLSIRGRGVDVNRQSDLDFIFRELRNLDHQHWSMLLAQMVQDELGRFHPGPDRGVKQGPLAVLTNALMPSVLIEIGYLSNQEEGRLLAQSSFQERAARAIADAVTQFFERYPPGSGVGGPG